MSKIRDAENDAENKVAESGGVSFIRAQKGPFTTTFTTGSIVIVSVCVSHCKEGACFFRHCKEGA